MSTKKGIVLGILVAAAAFAGRASAEPSYLVYPSSPAVFRFDASRYELVSPGDPRFDSKYVVAGQMLWDRVQNRIPVELYRAPIVTGFEPSADGSNAFVTIGNDFIVIVDGFSTGPHTLGNLCLRFWPAPPSNLVQVFVNGQPANSATLGLAPVDVHTAIGGGYYSDTGEYHLTWVGASGIEIVAFSDKNANRAFEGVPAYRIIAQDNVVATEQKTWGSVKALYR